MDQENIESTLTFYETAIRELEASVSLCTLCEVENNYLNSEETENRDSVSSFDLSSSGDTTSIESRNIEELPQKNYYPDTTIGSHKYEKFDNDNISSSSTTFSDFLDKTTKEVCEKLSNSRWNVASWDTCNEKPLKQNTEYETVLPTDLLTDEVKQTNEISKNLIKFFKNNTNDINDNEEKPEMKGTLKITEISKNDLITRKRSNISLQARTIVDISDLKEFSESFMMNSKARKKKSKMFDKNFCVSSMTFPVEKRTNDEEISDISKNIVEKITLIKTSQGRQKRSNESGKIARSVKEEILFAEEKNLEKNVPGSFEQSSTEFNTKSVLPTAGNFMPFLEDQLEEIPRKKPKIIADEIIVSAIHIPLKRYKYFPTHLEEMKINFLDNKNFYKNEEIFCNETLAKFSNENQIVSRFNESNSEISSMEVINQTAEDHAEQKLIKDLQENIKNSQSSSPLNFPNSQHRIQLEDAEKNYFFHNQDSLKNEEMFCDRVTIFSIEIPIASELKNISHFQILSQKSLLPIAEDDNDQEMKNSAEEIEALPENNKNNEHTSASVNSVDVQNSDEKEKNILIEKLTQEKEEMTSKDVELCSVEIPIASKLKKFSAIEIPMVETINQITEDDEQEIFLHNSISTKNINGFEELQGRNEENLESHPEKLILYEFKEDEKAKIVREKEDEQNRKASLKHDSSTVRALRKKFYPIDIPQVKDIQKSWEAVKNEFMIPKNKRQRRYRPLTQRKSLTSQDLKIIREKNVKRRKLLDSAINRLHKLNSYTTELRNIFRNDNSVTKMKNLDDVPKKKFVSTGTQTIDCGLKPLNCFVTPSVNPGTKTDIKSYATFVYNPYHLQQDQKNENTENTEAIASGANRENINLPSTSILAATLTDQNDNRVIEPIPKLSNPLNTQKNPIEFKNEAKIEDIHSYNPLRPKRVLRKIKKSAIH